MNKKLYLIALIISIVFMLAACSKNSEETVDLNSFLITEGVSLTCDMEKLAADEEYLAIMSAPQTIGQIINKIASQGYSIPENVYIIRLTDNILQQVILSYSGEVNISNDVMEKLKYRINGSVLANMINASYGSEFIAAASMMTWGKSYIQPNGWSDNMVLLLEYPGEFSSIVSFVQSGDGVISGSSVFVKNGDKDIWTLIDENLEIADIEYSHYSRSQLQGLLAK